MIDVRLATCRGMADGQRLGDHPAHRRADDVGRTDAEVVEQLGGVVGHVVDRVGGLDEAAARSPTGSAGAWSGPARRSTLDRPMSRLSWRITLNPAATSRSTNSCGQATSCAPHPMTSSSGGPSPCTSYSMVSPLPMVAAVMRRTLGLAAEMASPRICTIKPEGERVAPERRVDNVASPLGRPAPAGGGRAVQAVAERVARCEPASSTATPGSRTGWRRSPRSGRTSSTSRCSSCGPARPSSASASPRRTSRGRPSAPTPSRSGATRRR